MKKLLTNVRLLALGGLMLLNVAAQAEVINVNFNAHWNSWINGRKTGLAATGDGTNDFWNVYSRDVTDIYDWRSSGVVAPLYKGDLDPTAGSLTFSGASGAWNNGTTDNMYMSYLYTYSANITLTLENVPEGNYDVYVYAHGGSNGENSTVGLVSDSTSYGSASTTSGSGWNSVSWSSGNQYVKFSTVAFSKGGTVTITISPGVNSMAVVNGLQLKKL